MEYIITEYKDYNEQEILPLYESVGWINYIRKPQMLKDAYPSTSKAFLMRSQMRRLQSSGIGINMFILLFSARIYEKNKITIKITARTIPIIVNGVFNSSSSLFGLSGSV